MGLRKFGAGERITEVDTEQVSERMRKEASRPWTPSDTEELVQETMDSPSEARDR